ncbi:hypothetical protein E4U45_008365 [Claviceps purpurea]|nr:hypothetical protein E4U45_008365 [Claviceps purpurea]
MQLPPELRRHIWYFYCPDLSAKARVLEFTLKESDAPTTPSDHFSLKTDPTLASQTRSLRAMLSTHRESRSIAVRIFPDELALDMGSRRAIVRFRKESDVVFLMAFMLDMNYVPFATRVQNLAVGHVHTYCAEDIHYDRCLFGLVSMIKATYPNLKRLYSQWPVIAWPTDKFGKWCVTEYVHKYVEENYGRETDPEEYTNSRNNNLARSVLPRVCSLDELEEAGLEVRSMVKFESDDSNRRYHRVYSSDNDGVDLDESESERVGDDEVIELRNQSEQEPGRHRTLSISEFDIVDVSAELDTELQERLRKRYAIVVDPDEHGENETGHA